ncbi:MAG: LAGLIDADG family homing endonuclease [Candidatus Baldrarchaeia archaeon]
MHAEQNCVSSDTLVILPDGSIEEACSVHSEILSINEDLKVVSSPAFRFDATKEDALVIRTVGGFELTVSPDHIMFVMDEKSGLSTKKASELTLNDYIPIVTRVDIEGEPQPLPKIEYDSYKLSKTEITKLKYIMKKRGISQNKLSKIANVSRSPIKRLLKGEGVKKANIYKIFSALNCNLDKYLIGVERKDVRIPKITSPELCQIVGYFIGDGNVGKNYIAFEDENREVLEFYNELIQKVFGTRGRIFKDKNENQYVLTVCSKRLSLFFKGLGIGIREKQIPKLFHKVERKSLAALLRGLFDAEGMVRKKPNEVILTSGHRRILETVRLLLLRFGIVSGIYAMKRTDKISSGAKDYSYALIISGEDLLEFKSKVGFSHPEKKKKLEQIDNVGFNRKRLLPKEFFRTRVPTADFSNLRDRRWNMVTQKKAKEILFKLKRKGVTGKSLFEAEKLVNSDIAFVKIKEIKKINYKDKMIDFYVPVTNSFIANGVVVHNCIVQAAVFGVSTKGATLYTTHFPCSICAKLLINAEISEIVYEEEYEDKLAKELLQEAGIKVRRFKLSEPPEIV